MIKKIPSLLLVLLIAIFFRFTGLNWDQGYHLNPDERFLVMVGTSLGWPKTLTDYLDTASSKLNPHNTGFDFYVYGTFPVIVTKFIASRLAMDNYDQLILVGRFLTGLLDSGSVLLIYLLTRQLSKSSRVAILAAFAYAVSALPIQLAHFFTSDPYLVFFFLLSLLFASLGKKTLVLSGFAFALALSSKISGVIFLPIVLLAIIYFHRSVISLIIFGISALACFRFAYPYLFSSADLVTGLNPKVLANWDQLKSFNNPSGWFPPGVQWIPIQKYLYPVQNIILWGLGLPLSLLAGLSILSSIKHLRTSFWLIMPLFGMLIIFVYQGGQFAMPMRYFYPIYPFVAILVGFYLSHLKSKPIAYCLIPIALLLWPLATTHIYRQPHTRTQASDWILKHIPIGSKLSCEVWDDCLPLGGSSNYQMIEYPLYDPDSPQKSLDLKSWLAQTDYLILSSNRLYGSITGVPTKYPDTSIFYQNLFTEKLGFKKIAEFTSRPRLSLPFINTCLLLPFSGSYGLVSKSELCPTPGLSFIDDYADESWTVYDHPKVTIFQRTIQ